MVQRIPGSRVVHCASRYLLIIIIPCYHVRSVRLKEALPSGWIHGTDHFQSLMWRTLGLAISPPAFERLQSCMRHTMDQIDSIHCAGDTWWPADIYLQWPMLVASIVLLEHLPNGLHCARAQLPTTLRLSTCSGTLPYLQYSFKAQSLFTMELYTAYIIRNGCKLLHNCLK